MSIALLMVVLASTLTILIHLVESHLEFDLFLLACYFVSLVYSSAIIFQFISAAIACRDRLRAINQRILTKKNQSSSEIRSCVNLYRKIFLIIREINKTLTWPLIIIFAFLFVTITFEFYAVVRFFYKNSDMKYYVCISASSWSLVEIYPIFISVYVAESTLDEVENVKKIGYEILCAQRIFDPQTEKVFDYFLRSMERSKLQLKTIFFDLDWKLFLQVMFK